MPQVNWTVQLIELDGLTQREQTDAQGQYRFKQPARNGPYVLLFRDQNSTALHEVRRLTAGIAQTVSVTIDPNIRNIQSAYDRLQSLETLAIFAQNSPGARSALKEDLTQIGKALGVVREIIPTFTSVGQRSFLVAKANNIEQLANV